MSVTRYRLLAVLAAAFAARAAFPGAEGWENVNPSRRPVEPEKVLWSANLRSWLEGFAVELCEGAEARVRVVTHDGEPALEITKGNDRGWVVVTPKEPFDVPVCTELQPRAERERQEKRETPLKNRLHPEPPSLIC